eukprot:4386849-Alexandrium_andersonii.AAC.1
MRPASPQLPPTATALWPRPSSPLQPPPPFPTTGPLSGARSCSANLARSLVFRQRPDGSTSEARACQREGPLGRVSNTSLTPLFFSKRGHRP